MTEVPQAKSYNESKNGAGQLVKDWAPAATAFVALMALAVSIWQFGARQGDANREPFLQKQLEVAFRASEAVAVLATTEDPVVWEKARSDFWVLYWGQLSIVENQEVEDAMVKLGKVVPTHPVADVKAQMPGIQAGSYRLAHSLRRLMLESWHVDLPNLENRNPK